MAKRILGLEIGDSNIKLLEGRQKSDRFFVEKSRIIQTPPDTISDGVIWDTDTIYQVLKQEIESEKYKSKEIVIVIKNSGIITRDVRMDKMPPKDLKDILELQYHEYLLVDISEYQVTYKVVGEVTTGDSVEQEILIVAAPNKILNPLIEIADKLKLKIKSINIGSDAVANLFREDSFALDMKEESAMVIDIGGTSTTITIISGDVSVLSKNTRFGLQELNSVISNHFGSKQIGDIERFKEKYGGIFIEDTEGDIYSQFISTSLKRMLEHKLAPEIRRLLQFHFSRGKHKQIEKVYIIGGGASLKHIDEYMSDLLGIPCVAGITLDTTQIESNSEVRIKNEYFANILGLISEF